MNTVRKRIFCIASALLLAVISVLPLFSRPVKVQAASVPAVPGGSSESLMALLDILINAMVAGGASEAVADYSSEMDLLDAFLTFLENMVPMGESPRAQFYMSDGTMITLDDLQTGLEDGTVTLPNEQEWGKYRVGFGDDFASILEAWEDRGGGTGSGGEDPQDPKDPQFTLLDSFVINTGFLAMIGDFFVSLFNHEIEGLSPEEILNLPEYYYDPKDTGALVSWMFGPMSSLGSNIYSKYTSSSYPVSNHWFGVLYFDYRSNEKLGYETFSVLKLSADGKLVGASVGVNDLCSVYPKYVTENRPYVATTNLPIFSDRDALINYLLTGNAEGVLNGLRYDYDRLARNISSVLAPMAGIRLRPSVFQETYSGMKTAVETEISTKPATDVETDTDTYTETVRKPVIDVVPDHETNPEPAPAPKPGDDDKKDDTETDVDLDDYKRDLRLVFPFCIPFDFIALLRSLDADPVTPVFHVPFAVESLGISEDVVLDLSFMNDLMEMVRVCEVVSFLIMLMFATHKLIKW